VVRRLDAVLVGGSARGRAGENVLEEALSTLPPTLLIRDFAVAGKRVEFALALPDGRRMPVDSKWTAVAEMEALEAEEEPRRRLALVRRIEEEVGRRAREVAGYLEPSVTTPFAVACVPDAAFAVCRKAHAEAFARGVVLVPYGTALPVLLALFALAERYGDAGEVQGALVEMEATFGRIENTLENKVVRATTMLHNAADEVRTDLGRARAVLAGARTARPQRLEDVQPNLRAVPPG
jgi:DNA recombination protein RmuC